MKIPPASKGLYTEFRRLCPSLPLTIMRDFLFDLTLLATKTTYDTSFNIRIHIIEQPATTINSIQKNRHQSL